MKNRWKKRNSFTPAPVFFWLGDPYDSTYFTIRKPLVVFLLLSIFSLKMHHNSSKNGSPKKHQKTMPLETQKHPKMPWNSMFSFPKTPNRSKKSIFGRVVFLANFWVVIFPVFDKFWSQNGLPKLLGVLTFGVILEFKTLFLRPPHFFSIFLAKMLKKY